jgi:hypothetical protein
MVEWSRFGAPMFGKRQVFGKKSPDSASPAETKRIPHPTDADGVARVFSKELWDDPKRAEFLRKAGYTPDMPGNVLETREDRVARVKASAMRGLQREMAFTAELQARHGPISIMPLMIIDNAVWTADADGDWLQDMMDYEPCEEWNTIFLALDEETSRKLNIPMHPRAPLPLINDLVKKLIRELREKYGDFPSLEQRREIQATVKDEVGLLRPFLIQAIQKKLV